MKIILRRVVPAAVTGNEAICLQWSPRIRLVFHNGRRVAKDGINDAPRGFDAVLTRKQRCITAHRITEQALVRHHLVGSAMMSDQLDVFTGHFFPRRFYSCPNGDEDLRTEPEPEVVRLV